MNTINMNSQNAIEIRDLTCRYGSNKAVDNVSINIPEGTVFGLIGANGAGKTTIIKHILGLLRAQSGSVRVFNKDPCEDVVAVLSEIGYLSEDNEIPVWLKISDVIRYVKSFYPNWDDNYAELLWRDFELDLNKRIKDCSKGQKSRVSLITALSYRPKLLVLDEPSSGLDPIVRKDMLSAVIRDVKNEGRTVLFSSHLLNEVEDVCDHVAMLRDGKIVLCERMEDLKGKYNCILFRFETSVSKPPVCDGVIGWLNGCDGTEWTAVLCVSVDASGLSFPKTKAQIIGQYSATLDDIFRALYAANLYDL